MREAARVPCARTAAAPATAASGSATGPTRAAAEPCSPAAAPAWAWSARWPRWRPRCTERAVPRSGISRRRPACFLGQLRLGGGEAGDRHPIGRARHVIEPDLAAEMDRGRVAAMLAADAELEAGPGGAAALGGDPDHLADPGRVEGHERVVREHAEPLVGAAEARR